MRLVALLFSVVLSAWAQNTSLSGTVRDPNGLAISGASISLRSSTGASPKLQESSADGSYRFDNLAAGRYTLEISKAGFQLFTQPLDLKQTQTIDASLDILPASQTMTVEATLGKTSGTRMDIPKLEIPITVNTVPVQTIVEQGANDLPSALRNISGVSSFVWYGVYEYYTVRGFNIQDVVLVDGMRMQGNRINSQINNIESLEVVKGPASVNYGGGALAGSINVIRKKPLPTPLYDFNITAGRFKNYRIGAGITGPLFGGTKWLYRLDAQYHDLEGWRKAGARRLNVTPALIWQPTSRDRITIHNAFNRDTFDGDPGIPVGALSLPNLDLSSRYSTQNDFAEVQDWQGQIQWERSIGESWQFRNALQYRRTSDQYFVSEFLTYRPATQDIARGYLYFQHHRRPLLNQADFLGRFETFGIKHYLLAGYEYEDFYNATDRSATASNTPIAPIRALNPIDSTPPVTRFPLSRIDYFSNQTNAFYWQDHITLIPRVKLLVGGRYDIFRRAARNDPFTPAGVQGVGPEFRRNQEAYTYRAGMVVELTSNQQVHFSAATAFTPVTQIPLDGRELRPTTGRQFELAHKMQFFERRLNISTSLFNILRENVVVARPGNDFDQAGEQEGRGIDFDVTGSLRRDLMITANYGYVQPRFGNFFTLVSGQRVNLDGNQPAFVPKHTANLWLKKDWSQAWSTAIGTRYVGPLYANIFNNPRLGGYTTFSGNVTYRRTFAEYSMNLENMFNRQRYFTAAINDTQLYPGQPVNVFFSVRLRFKP